MKVVHALNAPDARHEITLLGGVWDPRIRAKEESTARHPERGVSKGVRGVLHQG